MTEAYPCFFYLLLLLLLQLLLLLLLLLLQLLPLLLCLRKQPDELVRQRRQAVPAAHPHLRLPWERPVEAERGAIAQSSVGLVD